MNNFQILQQSPNLLAFPTATKRLLLPDVLHIDSVDYLNTGMCDENSSRMYDGKHIMPTEHAITSKGAMTISDHEMPLPSHC